MSRLVGTVSRGLRAPIVKQGDDLANIVVNTVLEAEKNHELTIQDRDIVAVTESILARSQGNYCSIENIAEDIKEKIGSDTFGIIFPILSRNRFSICLKGMAKAAKKIYMQLLSQESKGGTQSH